MCKIFHTFRGFVFKSNQIMNTCYTTHIFNTNRKVALLFGNISFIFRLLNIQAFIKYKSFENKQAFF